MNNSSLPKQVTSFWRMGSAEVIYLALLIGSRCRVMYKWCGISWLWKHLRNSCDADHMEVPTVIWVFSSQSISVFPGCPPNYEASRPSALHLWAIAVYWVYCGSIMPERPCMYVKWHALHYDSWILEAASLLETWVRLRMLAIPTACKIKAIQDWKTREKGFQWCTQTVLFTFLLVFQRILTEQSRNGERNRRGGIRVWEIKVCLCH